MILTSLFVIIRLGVAWLYKIDISPCFFYYPFYNYYEHYEFVDYSPRRNQLES